MSLKTVFHKQDPFEIMREAIEKHGRQKFYVLFSGGKDSTCVAHFIATNFPEQFGGVIFTITGIGSKSARYHAIETAKKFNWPLFFTWPKEQHRFHKIVLRIGFPGRGNHKKFMGYLKYHSWERFIAEHKDEKPALISGVRHSESYARKYIKQYSQNPIDWHKNTCFIKPFFYYNGLQIWDYIGRYDLKISPVHDWLNISGDCFCGSFAEMWELKLIEKFDPIAYNYIKWTEKQVQLEIPKIRDQIAKLGQGMGSLLLGTISTKQRKLRSLQKQLHDLESYSTWGSGPTTEESEAQTSIEDYCGESCQRVT